MQVGKALLEASSFRPIMKMISKIRLLLEYKTYPIWLYDEDGDVIDNDNPPEWDEDQRLTDAFMAVSDFYDTFFIDTKHEFRFVGSSDSADEAKLKSLVDRALEILYAKNNGKYIIQNDIRINLTSEDHQQD